MPYDISSNATSTEVADAVNYLLNNFTVGLSSNPNTGEIVGPTGDIVGYLYRYIAIKYADSQDGTVNFGDTPTNRFYYGIRNTDSSVESTNPTDYIWSLVTGGFGTTKLLYYSSIGGRQIKFFISDVAVGFGWLADDNTIIDLDVITSSEVLSSIFTAGFDPSNIQVPFSGGVFDFTNTIMRLYGSANGIVVPYVAAQTDNDASFVPNSWRIGYSADTGYADIVKNQVTVGDPTLVSDYAQWPIPTAMTSPASLLVPIRYKNIYGAVVQVGSATQLLESLSPVAVGSKADIAYLYQWSTVTPGDPTGSSTYTWATGASSNYTGGNFWSPTLLANPGTPGISLWVVTKPITALNAAVTTTVSWTSGFTKRIGYIGDGIRQATASIYKWSVTTPAISGTATYTWSTGLYSPTTATSGWSSVIPSPPSSGFTLFKAEVSLTNSISQATSAINWTTSSISPIGYSGNTGGSSRIAYARIAGLVSPISAFVTTSGNSTFPPSGSWGITATWTVSDPQSVSLGSGSTNVLYQTEGIYDPVTLNTVWATPYVSSLEVGSLAAVSVNTGGLVVSDYIRAQSGVTTPAVSGTTMTGAGAILNATGTFAYGNSAKNLSFDGSTLTMNGDIVVTGNLVANAITRIATSYATNPIVGSTFGVYYLLASLTITTSVDGYVFVLFTAKQDYNFAVNPNSATNLELYGIVTTVGGADVQTNIAASLSMYLPAGNHTAFVTWTANSPQIRVTDRNLYMQGSQR